MERHIKRAQLLIVIAIGVNLTMFIMMYAMLTTQIGGVNERVNNMRSDLRGLDAQASQNFREISDNITLLNTGLDENTQNIGLTNLLIEGLGQDITQIGEESQAGIRGILSELNYTGTIDEAMNAVVLIIWTDKESVIGSGFVVSEDGYILTADHVVESFNGKTIRVKDREGNIYIASVEARDDDVDVAVLKVSLRNFPYLEFADSDSLASGSKVFALGAPEGFAFSASEGIVSAVRTVKQIKDDVGLELDLASKTSVVQTDAAITHGNSGGPLIDNSRRVVGLSSFGISKGSRGTYQDVEGLNFAIASNDVRHFYEESLK